MSVLGVLGFFVALFTLVVYIRQYKLHERQMKIELLTKYCVRYSINDDIKAVVRYLEHVEGLSHRKEVPHPDDHEVEMFMRFFEELELLIVAESIDEELASYMFYHYLQTFEKLKEQWSNVEYDSEEWKLFHNYMKRMKELNKDKHNYKIR